MLYEKLTPYDLDLFSVYASEYATHDTVVYSERKCSTKDLLKNWDAAKSEYLAKLFGGEFIIERPVEFDKPRRELRNNIRSALDYGELRDFHKIFMDAIGRNVTPWSDEYYFLLRLVDCDALTDNSINNIPRNTTITFHNGKTLKLTPGEKVMKALGKAVKMMDIDEQVFEEFRLKHSLFLNQKKLKGTLCLSIHPMDYITMSDNENGWSSCMSWRHNGEYRMGTVEMMNSPCVVVAYLKSDNEHLEVDDYRWNSKLWRTLIVATPNAITSIKNYPYQNKELTYACLETLRELAQNNLNWNFSDCPISEFEYFDGWKVNYGDNTYHIEFSTDYMYNDFGCSTHYGVISPDAPEYMNIHYSGKAQCMHCGMSHNLIYEAQFVTCEDCTEWEDPRVQCSECGEYTDEDYVYWVEGEPLCECCYCDLAGRCEFSDDYYFNENLHRVYLASTPDKPKVDDASISIAHQYTVDASLYGPPSWIATYFKRPPRVCEETGRYYWNREDISPLALRHYFYFYTDADIEDYFKVEETEN